MRKAYLALSGTLLLALGGLVVPGCGSSFSDQCEGKIQCEGGNDADIDACTANADGLESVASAYGCDDNASKYIDCVTSTGHCSKGHWVTDCDDQRNAVASCEKAASGNDVHFSF